jgi:trk system potassium uptake protein TrkA
MEEGVSTAGAFVALANLDEENILLSVFAKSVGCNKLITKINRIDYDHVLDQLDLDTVICPKNVTADIIVRFVRAMQNTMGSNVETMYNIIQGKVEASEFIVKENSPIAGIPLCDLKFKSDVLVASITRNGEVIIPRGQDCIQTGDAVVIVSKHLGLQDVTDVLK